MFAEILLKDGYSVAIRIKGPALPTIEKAQSIYDADLRRKDANHDGAHKVIGVMSIEEEEVRNFFDCSDIDNWKAY